MGALEEDLLGGDHGEPGASVLLDGVAKLGPLAALDGATGEAGGVQTWGPAVLKDDLGGDHGEPRVGTFLDGIAELGPLAALDGAAGEAGLGELADAGRDDDLDLVAVVVNHTIQSLVTP